MLSDIANLISFKAPKFVVPQGLPSYTIHTKRPDTASEIKFEIVF